MQGQNTNSRVLITTISFEINGSLFHVSESLFDPSCFVFGDSRRAKRVVFGQFGLFLFYLLDTDCLFCSVLLLDLIVCFLVSLPL